MASIKYAIFIVMRLLSPMVLVFGTMLVIACSYSLVHAQSIETRIESLEKESFSTKLDVDHRLTVLETLLKDLQESTTWFKISTGGTGLLIIKASLEVLGVRNKAREQEDE